MLQAEEEDDEGQPTPLVKATVKPLALEEEEDEDNMADGISAMDAEAAAAAQASVLPSLEFTEALQMVTTDCWDITAWQTYIEEADQGRSGSTSVPDAYARFLSQFPRASKFWKALADYYIEKDDMASAKGVFEKCLSKCRNVPLWLSYLKMKKKMTKRGGKDDVPDTPAQTANRKEFESDFEKAIENVGYAVDADEVWRDYVNFIREWPDATNVEKDRRRAALRKLYQRALCVPMDCLDVMWKEYEHLEKTAGESLALAEKILPEFNEKYLHAKAIYKERQRFSSKINFYRLAVPPIKNLQEFQQLDLWHKWIRFEMNNPDNLTPETHKSMMKMIYDQCLSCFMFHPEVWMSMALYEEKYGTLADVRAVYREAIETIRNIAFLRIALADLEELDGNLETARDVFRQAFEKVPCPLTFSLYQRFIRRHDGVNATRKLFSEALQQRADSTIGVGIYLAHAQTELDINCKPEVALRVLELTRNAHPQCIRDIHYVRALVGVLLRMGDLKQIQWIMQLALGDDALSIAHVTTNVTTPPATAAATASGNINILTSGVAELAASSAAASSAAGASSSASPSPSLSPQELVDLWEVYVDAETTLGLSDAVRMNELRQKRDRARILLDDTRARTGTDKDSERFRGKVFGLFECAHQITERYQLLGSAVPPNDQELKRRSHGRLYMDDLQRFENDRLSALREAGSKRFRGHWEQGAGQGFDDPTGYLAGIPSIIREILPKLPPNVGPMPDITAFLKHLRGVVLPLRPEGTSGWSNKREVENDGDESAAAGKRKAATTGDEDEDDDNIDEDDRKEDAFKKRQRAKLEREA